MAVHALGSLSFAAPGLSPAGLILRARIRLAGPRLDARVADGESPDGDPLLALRAAGLVSGRTRRRLAAGIEHVLADSDRRGSVSSAIPVHGEAIELARPALEQLAAALRSRESVDARGVALARLLLTEPAGPLYRPRHPDSLAAAAREALLALTGGRDG